MMTTIAFVLLVMRERIISTSGAQSSSSIILYGTVFPS